MKSQEKRKYELKLKEKRIGIYEKFGNVPSKVNMQIPRFTLSEIFDWYVTGKERLILLNNSGSVVLA